MGTSRHFTLIQRYFHPDSWDAADCITLKECPSQEPTCINWSEGFIDCAGNPTDVMASSWGLFQFLNVCWDPSLNPNSIFTQEQWDRVLDPNVNVWMASKLFRRSGWHPWTTCRICDVCDVDPPEGWQPLPAPIEDEPPPPPPPPGTTATSPVLPMVLGTVLLYGSVVLFRQALKGQG